MEPVDSEPPIRPHRKGPYVHRTRVYVRVDDRTVEKLDRFARVLKISRAHLCDVALEAAMHDGPLGENVRRRVAELIGSPLPQRPIIVVMFG